MKSKELFPSVAVVIVTWNNKNDFAYNLESVVKSSYPNLVKVVVVDNCSSDGTPDLIEQAYPQVELIRSAKNDFFTGGNNRGFKFVTEKYKPDFVIVLNPDTKVEDTWIEKLVAVAQKDPKIGIVVPKIVFWNNKNEGLINSAGLVYDGFMQAYDRGVFEKDAGQYDTEEEVVAVSGTCMLIRSEMIFELGELFWLALKMYLDDLELCLRAKKAGWKIVYSPGTKVLHSYMQSTNQNKNVRKRGWLVRNWLLIAFRHYGWKSKLAVLKKFLKFHFFKSKI